MTKMPYKELLIWQKAMELTELIYEATKHFPSSEEFGLKSQMRRSAVSIPSNIAEGSRRGTDRDYVNFILIAQGSLAELETQTLIAWKVHFLNDEQQNVLANKMNELARMLTSFRKKLLAPC